MLSCIPRCAYCCGPLWCTSSKGYFLSSSTFLRATRRSGLFAFLVGGLVVLPCFSWGFLRCWFASWSNKVGRLDKSAFSFGFVVTLRLCAYQRRCCSLYFLSSFSVGRLLSSVASLRLFSGLLEGSAVAKVGSFGRMRSNMSYMDSPSTARN